MSKKVILIAFAVLIVLFTASIIYFEKDPKKLKPLNQIITKLLVTLEGETRSFSLTIILYSLFFTFLLNTTEARQSTNETAVKTRIQINTSFQPLVSAIFPSIEVARVLPM